MYSERGSKSGGNHSLGEKKNHLRFFEEKECAFDRKKNHLHFHAGFGDIVEELKKLTSNPGGKERKASFPKVRAALWQLYITLETNNTRHSDREEN